MDDVFSGKKGRLYIVATPIGNLEDVTIRALRVLKEVDLVAAEDTRRTKILLKNYHIDTPITSLYEHNERQKRVFIVSRILEGTNVAYVSDAGTPGISDPGYLLIRKAVENDIQIVPIPGASAVIAALSVSGLPINRFVFHGFLPVRSGHRRQLFEELRQEESTIVFYESPKRIADALVDASSILGDRKVAVLREMTKLHEEILRGSLSEVINVLKCKAAKGEFTVVIEGFRGDLGSCSDEQISLRIRELLNAGGISRRDAIKQVASETGVQKKRIYDLTTKQKT